MLQKLPNKTLYRKRNCWAPKKIYKNAKRVDKSKDICLPDNLSEKDFLINGDFFYCSVPKWKIAKEPTIPTVPWNPSGWLVSPFFPFSYWRREGQLKKFTMYFCCSMRENMSRSPRCAGRTICRQKTSSKTVSLQFPTKPHSTYKMTILLELLTLFETHKIVTNNEKRRVLVSSLKWTMIFGKSVKCQRDQMWSMNNIRGEWCWKAFRLLAEGVQDLMLLKEQASLWKWFPKSRIINDW